MPGSAASRLVTSTRRGVRLLRLLGHAGLCAPAGLVVFRAMVEASPVLVAVAGGRLAAALTGGAARPGDLDRVWVAVAILGAALVTGRAAESLQGYFTTVVAQRVNGAMRERLRAVATAPADLRLIEDPAFQADVWQAGDLGLGHGRARSPGAAAVGQAALLLRLTGGFAAAAVVAVTFSAVLALALLTVTLTIRALLRGQWMRLAEIRHGEGRRRQRARYWASLATEPEAAKELRIFGLDYWTVRRYQRDEIGGIAGTWRATFRTLRAQAPVVALSAVAAALALGVPGHAAVRGAIPASTLVTCVFAAWALFGLAMLGTEVFDIEYGAITVRAYDELIRRHGTAAAAPPGAPPPVAGGHPPVVRFDGVTFGYPGGSGTVLDGLTLELRPGAVTALVGRNGAGKTTLIKLLAGLQQPSAGRITVDGVPLAELDPRAWRRRLAVLFQDFVRYPESVRANVVAGAPEAHDDLPGVRAAILRAGLSELVEGLPDGLETPLSSEVTGGVDLSGGQWQRVALARVLFAVAHGRQIVVLDEPTSHLDVAMEADFHRRIIAAMPGVTVALISHRLSTVRPADTILLLSGGRIVEAGDHDALTGRESEYARLYNLQAARFAGPGAGKVRAEERSDEVGPRRLPGATSERSERSRHGPGTPR